MSSDRVAIDSAIGTLELTQVYKSDEGTYTCTALNNAGNDSHAAQLFVRGNFTVSYSKHLFYL